MSIVNKLAKLTSLSAGDEDALDRPIWSSLNSKHSPLAIGTRLARRYPATIAPFAALFQFTDEAVSDLHGLAADAPAALLSAVPLAPLDGLAVQYTRMLCQMVFRGASDLPNRPVDILGANDAPAMLDLTALTKPGPFSAETYRLGRYIGIRDGDRLVAMAGERMRLDGYTEISAVCVHPDYRGEGYARTLMKSLIKTISAGGNVPFLHVLEDNQGAIALYERLGFVTRTKFHLTVVRGAAKA